jgi:hypothetical protein
MKGLLLVFLLVFTGQSIRSFATPHEESSKFAIGSIYYFGYEGIDLTKVQERLPVRVGDLVSLDKRDMWGSTRKVIERVTGRPSTEISPVCCDASHRLILYIGLSGESYRPLSTVKPQGNAHLLEAAVNLYDKKMEALVNAVQRGASDEDDSMGYAVSKDPAARKIDLEVRAYAAKRGPEFEDVLRGSSDAHQRQVAAELLGYADRSPAQIGSLAAAVNDADRDTRNNAVRALAILARAKDSGSLNVDPAPFIALLFSGDWSDRNKGSLLLFELSAQRDPSLLSELRGHVLQPLIEGARWDLGHAYPFLVILGRIADMSDKQIYELIDEGNIDRIIQAAQHVQESSPVARAQQN